MRLNRLGGRDPGTCEDTRTYVKGLALVDAFGHVDGSIAVLVDVHLGPVEHGHHRHAGVLEHSVGTCVLSDRNDVLRTRVVDGEQFHGTRKDRPGINRPLGTRHCDRLTRGQLVPPIKKDIVRIPRQGHVVLQCDDVPG